MGYRIDYEPNMEWKYPAKRKDRNNLRTIAVVLVITAAVWILSAPSAHNALEKALLPGDTRETKAAVENMITMLRSGETVKDAVTALCLEIISESGS